MRVERHSIFGKISVRHPLLRRHVIVPCQACHWAQFSYTYNHARGR
jgi:hypothetical protein